LNPTSSSDRNQERLDALIEAHKDTRSGSEGATKQKDSHCQNLIAEHPNRRRNLGEGVRNEEKITQSI
jgi:hypothetical protein